MNAAAKAVSQGSIFDGTYRREWLTKPVALAALLIFLVLISALTVIYVKELERRYISETQSLQSQINRAKIMQSQLLLERGTWSSSARIAKQATSNLHMVQPEKRRVIVI